MTALQDFNKLHIGLRSIALSLISVFPFFFISIYLFHHNLIPDNENYSFYLNDFRVLFLFSLCFALSLFWIFSVIVFSIIRVHYIEKFTGDVNDLEMPFVLSYFYSIIYLVGAIFLNYYLFHCKLLGFLLLAYALLVFELLRTVGGYVLTGKARQKGNK
jgi:hypothetical protein